eukprot:TRINITY_DN55350_c0_g1_i2.p1 TRINITY_DN55350_c0_g1~~TRINITY_DN55350_c0_g1_i2.p1  ORF type:complete len:154 (+),score=29.86 TRINITY_DN55350_c0_g1_i2:88-549(+)
MINTLILNLSFFFFLMIRRPPRSTLSSSSAASDVYKRQVSTQSTGTEYTGIESYVVSCVMNGSVVFFPVGRAIALEDDAGPSVELAEATNRWFKGDKQVQNLAQRMDSMESTLETVVQTLANIDARLFKNTSPSASHDPSRSMSPRHRRSSIA